MGSNFKDTNYILRHISWHPVFKFDYLWLPYGRGRQAGQHTRKLQLQLNRKGFIAVVKV
jgi:hypothetical protein